MTCNAIGGGYMLQQSQNPINLHISKKKRGSLYSKSENDGWGPWAF
jgi:hypothetical protein